MTRYELMLRALAAGDLESALACHRCKAWTADERARARRLLATSRDMALEIL